MSTTSSSRPISAPSISFKDLSEGLQFHRLKLVGNTPSYSLAVTYDPKLTKRSKITHVTESRVVFDPILELIQTERGTQNEFKIYRAADAVFWSSLRANLMMPGSSTAASLDDPNNVMFHTLTREAVSAASAQEHTNGWVPRVGKCEDGQSFPVSKGRSSSYGTPRVFQYNCVIPTASEIAAATTV